MALKTQTWSTGDYAWHSWSNGYVISLTLTEESVNVSAGTSRVSYLFTISNTDNNRFYSNGYSWNISVGGQTIAIENFGFDLQNNYTTQTIASGTLTVSGTRNVPFSVSVPNVQSYNSYGPPAMSLSGTWQLSDISSPSKVSCPQGIIGNSVNVAVTKANDRFTHTLTYRFGDLYGIIATKTALSVVPWTIPADFYFQIPNAKKGVGTITCVTYDGDTEIGTTSCTFYASVDSASGKPGVTQNIMDVNGATVALTGDSSVLVRYYSNAQVFASGYSDTGASIASLTMTHNGGTYSALPVTVYGVENGEFRFNVTDSRGYKASLSVAKTVIPYIKLTCNLSDNKPDGDGNMTVKVSGNYFNNTFGAVSNTLTVQFRYKESGGAYCDWITMTPELGVRSYNAEVSFGGLDYKTAYTFQARAVDRLAEVASGEYTARATPVFDWGEKDFNVNGTLKINGKALEYIVEQGKNDLFIWRKWSSGLAELWYLGKYSYTHQFVALPFVLTAELGCFAKQMIKNDSDGEAMDVTIYSPYTDGYTLYTKKQINGVVYTSGYLDTPIYIVGRWE